ncbi:excalibur domain containing protein [Bifidobacterium parmae]|uniref:Excalibur domain containing protein n=2 Tax=Bifidobacterium parmae TaxID=361854 RepID=A0A2N5J549_9BIFI|nr:excalibur domain containing protein [Bifidobacterium parmae]
MFGIHRHGTGARNVATSRAFATSLAAAATVAMAATMLVAPASATSTDFEGKAATEVLATLKTKGRAPKTGYARTQFGAAWADVDHNGCDTRNDILKRDMTDVTFKAGTHDCIVMTGTLADPYTGKTISFKRGNKTSSAVQIDHVVALSDAWQKGAQKLSASQRKNLANDPYNLLAVDGPSNQQKSDGDAATWLPKNKSFRCEYVARQIGVKAKYSLWVTKAERKAMTKVLATCPTQTVPLNDEAQATADAAEAQRKAEEEAAAKAAAEEAQRQAEAQQQQQQQQQDANVYYPNCAAVRAAGKAPLYQGQPGYSTKLDRDRDGVACE